MSLPLLIAAVLLLLGQPNDLPPLRVPGDHATIAEAVAEIQQLVDVGLDTTHEIVVTRAPGGTYGPVVIAQTGAPFDLVVRGRGGVVIDAVGAQSGVLVDWPVGTVTLTGLTVRRGAPHGIERLRGNLVLERCTVEHSAQDGIHLAYDPGNASLLTDWNADLGRCRVVDSGRHGIATDDAGQPDANFNHVRIRRCVVSDTDEHGLWIAGGRHWLAVLTRNRVTQAGGHGIAYAVQRNQAVVTGNAVRDVALDGVRLEAPVLPSDKSLVRRNRVRDAGGAGLELTFGANTSERVRQVFANRVRDVGGAGLAVHGGAPEIQRNHVVRAGVDGLVVDASAIAAVKANVVRDAGLDGVVVLGSGNLLSRNLSRGAGRYGFSVVGADNVLVRNTGRQSGEFDLFDVGAGTVLLGNAFGTLGP